MQVASQASNLILLEGPSGAGKTAAVYACAAELGLKVIEVNPAMPRAGRHVLASFGEATQSHELAKWSSCEVAKQESAAAEPAKKGGKAEKKGGKPEKPQAEAKAAASKLFFGAGSAVGRPAGTTAAETTCRATFGKIGGDACAPDPGGTQLAYGRVQESLLRWQPRERDKEGGEEEKITTPLRAQQKGRHAQGASMGGPTGIAGG